jgi:prepilin-type N-terminal cleavage/methylation domain-containing protein
MLNNIMIKNNFKMGFTLVEILLVLAILVVIISIIVTNLSQTKKNQVLKNSVSDIVSALNKASSQTLASVNSRTYGVHFESDRVIIFSGTTFDSGASDNETILISSPATISNINLTGGVVNVYFNKLTNKPSVTGTITISVPSVSSTITIGATGIISS